MLGLHSGTARGHERHTKMTLEELKRSLIDGRDDLRAITAAGDRFNEAAAVRCGKQHPC